MEQTIPYKFGSEHHAEKPTAVLGEEHRIIERVLASLERLTAEPVGASLEKWRLALVFFREFADQCHHFKEENVLFPALEEHGIPVDGGPIGTMLTEHEEGREHIRSMAAALDQVQAGNASAHESLVSHAAAYLTLLRDHIQKEDDVLFRMVDEVIPEVQQREILKRFEAHETEEIGVGAHDRYLKIARDLETA